MSHRKRKGTQQRLRQSAEAAILGLSSGEKRDSFIDLDRWWETMHNGIIYGQSGAGKTVLAFNMLNTYLAKGFNNFVNDLGKGYDPQKRIPTSEILMLFSEDMTHVKGVRAFVPPGCTIVMPEQDIDVIEVSSYEEIFRELTPRKVNVISFDSFILSPLAISRFWALLAIEILTRSKRYAFTLPLIGIIDQINHCFPSSALKYSGRAGSAQDEASNYFARFLMDCRGTGIKLVATSHDITQVKVPVRVSFQWKWFKAFTSDVSNAVPRIKPAQGLISTLDPDEAYATDDKSWGDLVPGIPNIRVESSPVYYKGAHVIDPFWALESQYAPLLELSYETYMARRIEYERRRWQIASLYLLGHSYREIADQVGVNDDTVRKNLNRCREHDYYVELESLLRPSEEAEAVA